MFGDLDVVHVGVQLYDSAVSGRSTQRAVPVRKLTLPGLNSSSGSMACFIVLINCTVPTPSSCTKNSFFPTPTPCSPVPERTEKINNVSLVCQQHINVKLTRSIHPDRSIYNPMNCILYLGQFVISLEQQQCMEVSYQMASVVVGATSSRSLDHLQRAQESLTLSHVQRGPSSFRTPTQGVETPERWPTVSMA